MNLRNHKVMGCCMRPFLLAAVLLTTWTLVAMAQTSQQPLQGVVVDEDGMPVIGATVELSGSRIKTVTDADGRFTLGYGNTPPPYTLTISYIGMETNRTTLRQAGQPAKITLKAAVNQLGDVVVTGYRTLTKHNMAGSVAVLTDKEFSNKVPTSMDNLLQGLVAGVAVSNPGQPGEASKIRIRGINTMEGSAEPLWIVDGVPLQDDLPAITSNQIKSGDLSQLFVSGVNGINPNDIENVTILKDASAAAIYGSRAAGGVIVVTTKRGRVGKMKVNYSMNLISQFKPQRDANLMDSREKLAWEQELWDEFSADRFAQGAKHTPVVGVVGMLRAGKLGKNGILQGTSGYQPMTPAEQDEYIAQLAQNSTNWFDTIFRNTFSMNHSLSLSGGSEKATYYTSLGMNSQKGLLRGSDYRRYNLNMRLNLKPAKKMSIDLNIKVARQDSHEPAPAVDPFQYAYFANPYEAPYHADGSYRPDMTYFNLANVNDGGKDAPKLPVSGFNILNEMENTQKSADKNSFTGSIRATYKITDWLSIEGIASYTHDNNNSNTIIGANTLAAFRDRLWFHDNLLQWDPYGSITQSTSKGSSYNTRLQLNFHKTLKDIHDITLYGGAELRGNDSRRFQAKQYGYDDKTKRTIWPTNPNPSDKDAERYKTLMENLVGRAQVDNRYASFYLAGDYMLQERYVVNFSFRTDGSNNFGSREQFNPTYSAGLGWHLHQEQFMKPLRPVISHLSMRLSGGFTGNIVRGVDKQLVLKLGTTSWNGIGTATISTTPNPHLRWEKTMDGKMAIDLGLFKDRLNLIFEGYYRKSTDIITTAAIVSTTGFTSIKYNSSDIVNKGLELTLNATPIQTKDFRLNLSGNFAYNYNYLSKYRSSTGGISNGRYVGYPLSAVFSGKPLGIDPDTGTYLYQLRPDARIYSAGSLTSIGNYRYFRGTANHPYTGGMSLRAQYKEFSLSMGGAFAAGGMVSTLINSPANYNVVSTKSNEIPQTEYSDLYRNHLNVTRDMIDRWTPNHTTGITHPRITDALGETLNLGATNPTQANSAGVVQGAFLQKIGYLKIRDITLGYTLPRRIAAKAQLSNATLSLTMSNLLTFTNYTGLDPENPGAVYPTTRSISFNINLGF